MSKTFVLDACALIAILKNEDGADKVAVAYKQAESGEAEIIMNRVNLLEVFYGFYHDKGKEYAEKIMDGINQSVISITEFDELLFPEAGRLKASYKISLADSIVLSQALAVGGELLTADHHEFDAIEGNEPIVFHWIRRSFL
ncbi:MAG: PIN domain-containing protein [Oscillospiraceae bacterium]|nr:PIN domain-containing protein [Oscillospiraceae bacterium]